MIMRGVYIMSEIAEAAVTKRAAHWKDFSPYSYRLYPFKMLNTVMHMVTCKNV
jgi:hypothetical protein